MVGADRQRIEEFIRDLLRKLPPAVSNIHEELAENLRAGVEPMLQKMHLVSREEYDVQVMLLERLRKRVAELEKQLEQLSQQNPER